MKNIFKLLLCLSIITCMTPDLLKAQNSKPLNMQFYDDEPYHYGFILGYNQMPLSINYIDNFQNVIHPSTELPSSSIFEGVPDIFLKSDFKVLDINPQLTHGFTVGIVGNLRLAKYFDLRLIPSLSFGERKITYQIVSLQEDPISGAIKEVAYRDIRSTTHSTFIEFPLQIKYRSKRYNNSAAYIIAGANYKIDMSSHKKAYDSESRPKTLIFNRHDIAAEVGAGFDFYTGYFKLGVEIKMSYGLLNVAKKDNYLFTSSFDSLRNKTFQLSFTFE